MTDAGDDALQRVLVVDDDQDLLESIAELLEARQYQVATASNSAQALQELRRISPQVALVDLRLGLENGLDVIIKLREKKPELICIVVTANTDKASTEEALKRDAYDYLIKPVDSNWLLHVISRAFYVVRLNEENHRIISELKRAHDRARKLALSDSLTSLCNRLAFQNRLAEVVSSVGDVKKTAGILFIDLDGFKDVNDAHGHLTGDRVLKKVAERLKGSCRTTDMIARLGGDEFAIVLDGLNEPDDIWPRVKRIQDCFQTPITVDNILVDLGASIGISFCPEDGTEAEELIRKADIALYAAKSEGRGMSSRFDLEMDRKAQAKRKLDNDLKRALANEEFELYCQPQINLKTQKVAGVEVLLRWNNPEIGIVTPDKFIDATETSGLIVDIGEWIIGSACKQLQEWRERNLTDLQIAVNLSMRQLRDGSFFDIICSSLDKYAVNSANLELELTESAVNTNEDHVNEQLNRLRELGVQLALDDFGTGYSSLTRLKKYPIDCLKIDRSFVHGLDSDAGDRFICMATMQLAKNLRLETVAEGIETRSQLDFFFSMGCDKAQGYYFARPFPIRDFEQWALSYAKNRFTEDNDKKTVAA